jgi:choline dehydrogenase
MDAGVAAGLKANPDYNSGQQNGIGPLQVTTMNGRRVSVVDAFIKPIAGRTNLRVLTSMQARRVLWQERQAVGVEVLGAQGPMSVIARREVVLSAGAIHSPQLLMLSGIGPSYELQQLGLEVCADSPGVGQNLQDHVQIRCVYEARNVATLNQLFHSRFRQAWAGMQYFINRSGWLAQGALRVVAFTNANGDTSRPDLQLFFSPLSTDQLGAAR